MGKRGRGLVKSEEGRQAAQQYFQLRAVGLKGTGTEGRLMQDLHHVQAPSLWFSPDLFLLHCCLDREV